MSRGGLVLSGSKGSDSGQERTVSSVKERTFTALASPLLHKADTKTQIFQMELFKQDPVV